MIVDIDEADRQALVLAIAKLTFTRPGWLNYMREIAARLHGVEMFDEFWSHGPESAP